MQANAIEAVKSHLFDLQTRICTQLETYEASQRFQSDTWHYDHGGGGDTRVLENGTLIEKGGVNVSHIKGRQLPQAATQKRPHLVDSPFQAMGLSLVIHPWNPYVPTVHANFRFFCAEPPDSDPVWWFGGGFDLTPYYGFDEDCRLWHQQAKQACEVLDHSTYPRFKQWCDDYFYLPHRQEWRGIGGIFFDDVNEWPFEQCFRFIQSAGEHFLEAYDTIIQRRYKTHYGERERAFQCYRRGRYVEFNLLYDRGTLFGLQSGGRTESILISMPPTVNWRYQWHPEQGTPEARLYERFIRPQAWVSHDV